MKKYINEKKNQGNLLANQNDDYHANVQESSLNMNNEETNTQYQDKYFLNKKSHDNTEDNTSTFENLAGNRVSYKDINHNNTLNLKDKPFLNIYNAGFSLLMLYLLFEIFKKE